MSLNPVEWELLSNGDALLKFNHSLLEDMKVSPYSVPTNERGGVARALLSMSALSCMAGTLNAMLKARDVEVKGIKGSASVQMGKNEKNRDLVDGINLNIDVDIEEQYMSVLERCIKYLEDGCLVTRGLKKGIKVTLNIQRTPD
ncbi:MAG: OsmC family protein [Candidatus Bathyarchaeota archaeon]|nr:OsmC family protein [Candidatus Bathyarchaeota archaeon]